MKKFMTIAAALVFMLSCTSDASNENEEIYETQATGKDCVPSSGNKDCDDN